MFNQTFYHFFFGFIAILAIAFGILIWAGYQQDDVAAIDNIAQPQ
jgi:hypothetical protein